MRPKLIVNADDFGLAACITEGIEAAHCHGIVTSTSLLAVGEAFELACQVAKRNPKLDIGIHLCLDEEKPVSSADKVFTLVTTKGYFFPRRQLIQRLLSGRVDLCQVRCEWELQIKKALDQGLSLTHADSHGHIHCWPTLLPIAVDLAAKYGIQYLRIPIESGTLGWTMKNAVLAVSYLASLLAARRKDRSSKSADFFMGLKFGGNLNETNLLTLLRRVSKPGSYEIMCHPGYFCEEDIKRWRHWGYHWKAELNALQSQRVKEFIRKNDIKLSSFSSL